MEVSVGKEKKEKEKEQPTGLPSLRYGSAWSGVLRAVESGSGFCLPTDRRWLCAILTARADLDSSEVCISLPVDSAKWPQVSVYRGRYISGPGAGTQGLCPWTPLFLSIWGPGASDRSATLTSLWPHPAKTPPPFAPKRVTWPIENSCRGF